MAMEAVSIKGTKNGLVIMLNPNADLEEIKTILRVKMERSKGFFKGAKYTLYSPDSETASLSNSELEIICQQFGLIPSADVTWLPEATTTKQIEQPGKKKTKTSVIPIRQQANHEGEAVLLVKKTLRSGQKVSSKNSIIVMGDVNPGAEVLSENSIYILGTCNGTAHAGLSGNLMAEIITLKYQPIVLRIGSITAEHGLALDTDEPVVAKVNRGKIVLESYYNSSKLF